VLLSLLLVELVVSLVSGMGEVDGVTSVFSFLLLVSFIHSTDGREEWMGGSLAVNGGEDVLCNIGGNGADGRELVI
jgi:hypothetical protein